MRGEGRGVRIREEGERRGERSEDKGRGGEGRAVRV